MMRGAPIVCGGQTEIRRALGGSGGTRHIHPDQMVFADLERRRRIVSPYLNAGEDPYPDVVLEVDTTTDVRENRLKLYEAWGFPEVWVEVPDAPTPGRRPGLRSGLRIHLLEAGRYVLSEESRAFPGWRAVEIHRALNEPVISEETSKILSRVGRAHGRIRGHGAGGRSPAPGTARRGTHPRTCPRTRPRTCPRTRRGARGTCSGDAHGARHRRLRGLPAAELPGRAGRGVGRRHRVGRRCRVERTRVSRPPRKRPVQRRDAERAIANGTEQRRRHGNAGVHTGIARRRRANRHTSARLDGGPPDSSRSRWYVPSTGRRAARRPPRGSRRGRRGPRSRSD